MMLLIFIGVMIGPFVTELQLFILWQQLHLQFLLDFSKLSGYYILPFDVDHILFQS